MGSNREEEEELAKSATTLFASVLGTTHSVLLVCSFGPKRSSNITEPPGGTATSLARNASAHNTYLDVCRVTRGAHGRSSRRGIGTSCALMLTKTLPTKYVGSNVRSLTKFATQFAKPSDSSGAAP